MNKIMQNIDAKRETLESNQASLMDRVMKDDVLEVVYSGFESVDKSTKGFRKGGSYLIAGLEKSGKTAFALTMVVNMLKQGKCVAIINTELQDFSFFARLTAIHNSITVAEAEGDKTLVEKFLLEFQPQIKYAGLADITDSTQAISFKACYLLIKKFVDGGIDVLFFDNLTVFNSQSNESGWKELAAAATKLINLTKLKKIVTFFIIHTNKGVVLNETPGAIRKMIEEEDPRMIFEKSISYIRRPSLSDVYGGGGYQLQLSGALIVWRPFQKYDHHELRDVSLAILDSFRDSPSGVDIQMEFKGDRSTFEEIDAATFEEAKDLFAEGGDEL